MNFPQAPEPPFAGPGCTRCHTRVVQVEDGFWLHDDLEAAIAKGRGLHDAVPSVRDLATAELPPAAQVRIASS